MNASTQLRPGCVLKDSGQNLSTKREAGIVLVYSLKEVLLGVTLNCVLNGAQKFTHLELNAIVSCVTSYV